jgi:hypothetical protein
MQYQWVVRGARGFVIWAAVCVSGCAADKEEPADATPPFRMSRAECANLLEIGTEAVTLDSVDGPSETQMALDALSPESADRSRYLLTFAVDQSFENLLERRMLIDEASAALKDPATGESYEVSYELDAPIELAPQELRVLTFYVTVPADRWSADYLLGLTEGAAFGMTIAPVVRVTVPDSDNCGYEDGMLVHAKEGTVEVRRADDHSDDVVLGILSGILKAFAHGGKL